MKPKIAIIGGTRGIGFSLLKQLLKEGFEVSVLVREASRMTVNHPQLRVVAGDAMDVDAIETLLAGQDVICDCLGTKNVVQPQTMFSRSAQNISKIITSNQLLIAVTGLGAGDSRGHCGFFYDNIFQPFILKRQYEDKDRQEQIIKETIHKWIIVRPGYLTNGSKTGMYRVITEFTGKHGSRISREDVADFIVMQIRHPTYIGQTPMLVY